MLFLSIGYFVGDPLDYVVAMLSMDICLCWMFVWRKELLERDIGFDANRSVFHDDVNFPP